MTQSNLGKPDTSSPLDASADLLLDARGLRCPLPLLRAKQSLRSLPVGALLHVTTTDSASVRDFQAYAKISGHHLESFYQQADEYVFRLRKAAPEQSD